MAKNERRTYLYWADRLNQSILDKYVNINESQNDQIRRDIPNWWLKWWTNMFTSKYLWNHTKKHLTRKRLLRIWKGKLHILDGMRQTTRTRIQRRNHLKSQCLMIVSTSILKLDNYRLMLLEHSRSFHHRRRHLLLVLRQTLEKKIVYVRHLHTHDSSSLNQWS